MARRPRGVCINCGRRRALTVDVCDDCAAEEEEGQEQHQDLIRWLDTQPSVAEVPLMADLYRRCARVGCGELTEGARLCDDCSAVQERSERMAAARAKVLEAW
jgi:hypothetical protein